jgi:hypothetical protein
MTSTSGENGEAPRGASSAALKGALLIGLAVIVGLFLLQRADDDPNTSATGGTTKPPASATTTTVARATTTTSTVPASPAKTPAELSVIVLNGGAATGQAAEMSNALTTAGYTNQTAANNWEDHSQQGNSVLCKPGRQREAVALSQQTALQGSTIGDYPEPVPSAVPADNDCIVVVGAAAGGTTTTTAATATS